MAATRDPSFTRRTVLASAGVPESAAALAPAPALASTARRVSDGSLVSVMMSSLRIAVAAS